LLKLYLISREQFATLAIHYAGHGSVPIPIPIPSVPIPITPVWESLGQVGSSALVGDEAYGRVVKLGVLDGIGIYSFTCPDLKIVPATSSFPVPLEYLRTLYSGLRQSFAPYSEHMILYYMYKRPGVNGVYRARHFIDVCGVNDRTWKKSATSLATDTKSTGGTETGEPIVNIITADNTSNASFNDTVKCSTADPNSDKGINFLELPSLAEGSEAVVWPAQARHAIEKVHRRLRQRESSILESESSSMCTSNLAAIERNEVDTSSLCVEEVREVSGIRPEDMLAGHIGKEKNTFIDEIDLLLKEIGPGQHP
jgi:hypothetical protein